MVLGQITAKTTAWKPPHGLAPDPALLNFRSPCLSRIFNYFIIAVQPELPKYKTGRWPFINHVILNLNLRIAKNVCTYRMGLVSSAQLQGCLSPQPTPSLFSKENGNSGELRNRIYNSASNMVQIAGPNPSFRPPISFILFNTHRREHYEKVWLEFKTNAGSRTMPRGRFETEAPCLLPSDIRFCRIFLEVFYFLSGPSNRFSSGMTAFWSVVVCAKSGTTTEVKGKVRKQRYPTGSEDIGGNGKAGSSYVILLVQSQPTQPSHLLAYSLIVLVILSCLTQRLARTHPKIRKVME